MLNSEANKDITFDVYGTKFHCHKCVLSARSSFFAKIFSEKKWGDKTSMVLKNSKVGINKF